MNSCENPLFQDGLAAFEADQYFEAHELWEDLWQPLAPNDPLKPWLQGLIQLAVGLYHWQRGNAHGARSLLHKAVHNLTEPKTPVVLPEAYFLARRLLQTLEGDSTLPDFPNRISLLEGPLRHLATEHFIDHPGE